MSEQQRLLTARQVMGLLAVSERTFYRLKHDPGFPKPVRIRRCIRYRLEDVEKFIQHHQRAR
jgi:predicted DNA-binding transcriptional regulator AlpA